MRLFIAVPSNRDHSPLFVASIVGLVQYHSVNGIKSRKLEDLRPSFKMGCSNIATARNDFVKEAISGGFTHLLFIDDDMVFPLDMLDVLCKYDTPVVAANCPKKSLELTYTAFGLDNKRLDSTGKTGYEQVMRVGTGIMLIDLSIFKDLPKPYFTFAYNHHNDRIIGEDYHFCALLNKHNIPIIIDHDISQQIGHVGAYTYGSGKPPIVEMPKKE